MPDLVKNIDFCVNSSTDAIKYSIAYFTFYGFKIAENQYDSLKFKRGSLFYNGWTFNPLKWKSEIFITFTSGIVAAQFGIYTSGQMVTPKEEWLWDEFMENYKRYINNPSFDFKAENDKARKATKKSTLKYLKWGIIGAVIALVPSGLLAYFTGISSIASIGAVLGALTVVNKKINNERRNTRL